MELEKVVTGYLPVLIVFFDEFFIISILNGLQRHLTRAVLAFDNRLTGLPVQSTDYELLDVVVAAAAHRRRSDGDLVILQESMDVVEVHRVIGTKARPAVLAASDVQLVFDDLRLRTLTVGARDKLKQLVEFSAAEVIRGRGRSRLGVTDGTLAVFCSLAL